MCSFCFTKNCYFHGYLKVKKLNNVFFISTSIGIPKLTLKSMTVPQSKPWISCVEDLKISESTSPNSIIISNFPNDPFTLSPILRAL
jgi:hypothetical protein